MTRTTLAAAAVCAAALLPADLVHALVALALGVTAVRLMQRWLL